MMGRKALLLITILTEGGLLLLGLFLMGGWQALSMKFQISWRATIYILALCLPMLMALLFSMRTGWAPLDGLRTELEEKAAPIFAKCTLFDLALIAFFAGAGEELFFRGWLQSLLVDRFGLWLGILAASVAFGLLHYLSTTYALYAGLTGLYLGIIYHLTGNLYIVMGIHALYDFIALVYLVSRRKSTDENLHIIE